MPVQGFDPTTGTPNGEPVPDTGDTEVATTAARAAVAAEPWYARGTAGRATALEAVAAALEAAGDELVPLADRETALGEARLRGELARTTGQLRLFADVLREGSYVEAILDEGDPAGSPPRPALARMLVPLGPVAVYAASNFPFAFSVAGGDTASALAAGCPVIVKAHPGHPLTSVRTGRIVTSALVTAGAPEGVFGVVHGFDAGVTLVREPAIAAAGFTGSRDAGRLLFELAATRPEPIPFYGELGSVNPVIVLPGAAARDARRIAAEYAASLTLGSGQFCTNPGVLFVPEGSPVLTAITTAIGAATAGPLLASRIRDAYEERTARWAGFAPLRQLAAGSAIGGAWSVAPRVFQTTLDEFVAARDELTAECFGPAGLVVTYPAVADLVRALDATGGSLTGSVHADPTDPDDRIAAGRVAAVLRRIAGRVVFNGWPTGVAVSWAMHHGGPWPATTAAAHTSVGATAIRRWLSPVCYQDWPDELLPEQLRDGNPLGITRRRDGVLGPR